MGKGGKVVVIGCSGTGALAARMLKNLEPSVDVTIIREEEEQGLLTRCATPYICFGHVLADPSYKDDSIFTKANINLVNVRAEKINRERKMVITADGKEYLYDKLVLATGARSIVPPIPGANLPGVFTLRTSDSAIDILHWLNTKRVKSVALVGGGAISVEIAYLAKQHGINVTMVEILEHILSNALDPDMSEGIEKYMRERGIDLRLSEQVKAINGDKKVERLVLASGEKIDADMVIICAGAEPRGELAREAGLEMGELGLKVNSYLQTSDPDIYSAGDLIEYPSYITGKPIRGQLRPNAVIGGRIIAKNILGRGKEYPRLINSFATKFFEKSIAGTGITETLARNNGIKAVSAIQSSSSQHSMMRGRKSYTVKLIFDKKDRKIIGGQIVSDSECPVKHIDAIAVSIRAGWNSLDLSTLRCAGQPELSPDPGMEPIALAAESIERMLD
jgi:NADPH-dependent 2,4-dienoyl-CoA reductase/sulfur reductase-like enzyme